MNVLIIGNGAREHVLAWKLRQSPLLSDLFVAAGNAGTATIAENVAVEPLDFEGIVRLVDERRIELVVVGPEEPLAKGLVDFLSAREIPAYGPTAAAAQLEASKWFAKEVMRAAGIATAEARAFSDEATAFAYAAETEDRTGLPPVVKADGLAAGKGVVVAATGDEARAAIRAALGGAFGASGQTLLLEERLSGPEVSAHAFCDGETALPMVYARDHKRLLDGNAGPNTGGMGAYSPPAIADGTLAEQIRRTVIEPTVRALAARGTPYCGTLYPGLMLTAAGPKVIEYNCRFGDPETQVLLPRLESDLLPILLACVEGRLAAVEPRWREEVAVGVVLASGGYPGEHRTGLPVYGLDDVDADVQVFHAGTRLEGGQVVTAGGRVLTVVATGATLAAARAKAYENVARIRFEGMQYRTDIGLEEATTVRPSPPAPLTELGEGPGVRASPATSRKETLMLTTRDSVTPVEMFPGVVRRTLNTGHKTMLCEVALAKGAVVPWHTHPHEQIGYCSRGRLRFRIGDEEREIGEGDSWVILGDVPHIVTALEDSIAIDIFSPVREEYR